MKILRLFVLLSIILSILTGAESVKQYDKEVVTNALLPFDAAIRKAKKENALLSLEQSVEYGKFIGHYDSFKAIKLLIENTEDIEIKKVLCDAAGSIIASMIKRVRFNFVNVIPLPPLSDIYMTLPGGLPPL